VAMAGLLIAGSCVAMEGRDVRVELTDDGAIDMSKLRGDLISLYGVYIGQCNPLVLQDRLEVES